MRRYLYFFFALDIIIFDQISKWFITEFVVRKQIDGIFSSPLGLIEWYLDTPVKLPFAEISFIPFFNIVMVWNQGISFGMFSGGSETGKWLLIGLAFFITLWFGAWLLKTQSRMQAIAIAMVIGGAIGNVIDRFRFGAVIDFIDFHVGSWHFPAFNVADSSICIGVGILIVHTLFFDKETHG